MKMNRLISVTLVTIMALTVVTGAGLMMPANAAVYITDEQILDALDCADLNWQFTASTTSQGRIFYEASNPFLLPFYRDHAVDLDVSFNPHTEPLTYAQIATTISGPGKLTFTFQGADTFTGYTGEFLIDNGQTASVTYSGSLWTPQVVSINVPAGQHTLTWRLSTTASGPIQAPSGEVRGVALNVDHVQWEPNIPPTITTFTAEPSTVELGKLVTANVVFSDPNTGDSHTASFDWGDGTKTSATAQPGVTSLSNTHTYTTTGALTVTCTLSDGIASVTQTALVTSVNDPPTAEAGPAQTVNVGALATLDGTGSTDPGNHVPLAYEWSVTSKPVGSTAQLSNPTDSKPTFTANEPGVYVCQLVVRDSYRVASLNPDTVKITVNPTKAAVLADLAALRRTVNTMPWYSVNFGMKYVMLNTIDTAIWQVKLGRYGAAAYTLNSQFVTRTDGCVLRGHPDIGDFVRTCDAQKQLYGQETNIVADLKWLQSNPS